MLYWLSLSLISLSLSLAPGLLMPSLLDQGCNLHRCYGCLGNTIKFSPKFIAVLENGLRFLFSDYLVQALLLQAGQTSSREAASLRICIIYIHCGNGSRSRVSIPACKQVRKLGLRGEGGLQICSQFYFALELHWNAFNVLDFNYPPSQKTSGNNVLLG